MLGRVASCLTDLVRTGDNEWTAGTLGLQGGTVFGGQLLGQTVVAAARTCDDMAVKSATAHFPRAVRDTGTLTLHVDTLHRGSTYATLQVELRQPDRSGRDVVAFRAMVLCHVPVEGLAHSTPMPAQASPLDARVIDLQLVPWECRIGSDNDLDDRAPQLPELRLWTRTEPLNDAPATHQALLAYLTDLTLIGTALLPHDGWSQLDAHNTLRTSVITHQLWFHQPLRIDDWLLLKQTSPVAVGGSAFGRGDVYTLDDRLVASYSQESMIRLPEAASQ